MRTLNVVSLEPKKNKYKNKLVYNDHPWDAKKSGYCREGVSRYLEVFQSKLALQLSIQLVWPDLVWPLFLRGGRYSGVVVIQGWSLTQV